MRGEQRAHAAHGLVRVLQQAGFVGEPEQLGEVLDGPRRLLAADHHEMVLVTVQPSHEYDAGLVELSRCLEDVT